MATIVTIVELLTILAVLVGKGRQGKRDWTRCGRLKVSRGEGVVKMSFDSWTAGRRLPRNDWRVTNRGRSRVHFINDVAIFILVAIIILYSVLRVLLSSRSTRSVYSSGNLLTFDNRSYFYEDPFIN
jgi:hypothetical protein